MTAAAPSLMSVLGHELRGPLTSLATTSGLLVDDFDGFDHEQLRSMVGAVHRRVLWVERIVENLLSASAIHDGRLHCVPQEVLIEEVIDEAMVVLEPLLVHRRQRLHVTGAKGSLVLADKSRVGQVITNLVTNAMKFSPASSVIDVSLRRRPRFLRVIVADRGLGIGGENARRLFEPFYRGPSSSEFRADGLGLGLWIVKSIVEAHGGRVGAANRRGGGAVFWFDLRAAMTPAEKDELVARAGQTAHA